MFAITACWLNEEITIENSFNIELNRVAIDCSGRLGSLYDGCRDRVLDQLNIYTPEIDQRTLRSRRCNLIKGRRDNNQNILKIFSLEPELRVSILLNLINKTESQTNIDYFHPINEYTRFILYSYLHREEKLADSSREATIFNQSLTSACIATHVITRVLLGTDLVIILQLPTVWNIAVDIDHVLEKLIHCLRNQQSASVLSDNDKNILDKIIYTKVYSNIPHLQNISKIYNVYRYIQQNENNTHTYPISYTIQPIENFSTQNEMTHVKFTLIPRELNEIIETYVIQLIVDIEHLEQCINNDITSLSHQHLKSQVTTIQSRLLDVKNKFQNEIQRIANTVIKIRSGHCENIMLQKILNDREQIMMITSINGLKENIEQLKEKENFIQYLKQRKFQYLNAAEHKIDENDDEKLIKYKLVEDDRLVCMLCSTDLLNKKNAEKLENLIFNLMEEIKINSELRLVYADFSDCSFQLSSITILLPPNEMYEAMIHQSVSQSSASIDTFPQTYIEHERPSATPTFETHLTDETINILLLGETGVGKSTFINAFANYLTFETLQQAENDAPIVLMPVSFTLTSGDHFEEHIVRFGDVNDSTNEDFRHPGQSVTQHCKSYVFHLNDDKQTKLRIIDTPGFGDTRGVEQDDRNMEHILEYINNLTHLNAICFLLKPNASRLNIFFRSCLTQLFSLLSQNALNNIIFCFTNARSTFYTPGDTAPLLKEMLKSLSIGDVPFKKENTFCFDSESFRYLVALQNKIRFDDNEKQEYERSWTTSVAQAIRLMDCVQRNMTVYCLSDDLQTIKNAQFKILRMVRPMLETMRNILRNLILHKMTTFKVCIQLNPKVNLYVGLHCLVCKPDLHFVGTFPIAYFPPHIIKNDSCSCNCSLDQHCSMDYVLEYKAANGESTDNEKQMTDMLYELCYASAEFAYFLMNIIQYENDDPFLVGFAEMVIEENDINDRQISSPLNLQLANDLRQLGKKYDEHYTTLIQCNKQKQLSDIYNLIHNINKYPIVGAQIAAVKDGQKIIMKQHEYDIPIIS